jgi:hypothetical protein
MCTCLSRMVTFTTIIKKEPVSVLLFLHCVCINFTFNIFLSNPSFILPHLFMCLHLLVCVHLLVVVVDI